MARGALSKSLGSPISKQCEDENKHFFMPCQTDVGTEQLVSPPIF